MKKIIFYLSLMMSLSAGAQTVGGAPGSVIDSSNNPSGQGFGGAMGGGNMPSNTTTPSTSNTPTNMDMSVPRGNELPQQRMEDSSNFTGGSLGGEERTPGSTIPPATSIPSDTPVAPSVPQSDVQLPRQNGTTSPTGITTP